MAPLLPSSGPAQAHSGGTKVAALVWRESGNEGGFDAQLKVWNYTNQTRRVGVTVELEGDYTIETSTTECDSFGCYTYPDYEYGTVVRRVSKMVLVPPFGTNRKQVSGSWTVPSGANVDFVVGDIVHAHI
jgi:hypothetical protein